VLSSPKSSMEWWDIYAQVPAGMTDAVSEYLQHLGSAGVVIHEGSVLAADGALSLETQAEASRWTVLYAAFSLDDSVAARVCALQQFLDSLPKSLLRPSWKLFCRLLRESDYLTQWQQFFPPLYIGTRLVIHPPWDSPPLAAGGARLVLDPGQAFGTGLHPSTHLCLTLLTRRLSSRQEGGLLDVGCGSGILSLAALQLGVETAMGVDIDARAVGVAERNAVLNGLQERVQFLYGSVESVTGQFTLITANIYLGPLIDMMAHFVQRLVPRGIVILSGILVHQELALRAAMQATGLEVRSRLEEAGWVALEGERVHGVSTAD
jgi:ribosomal protein L11 methyltransferase